MYRLEDIGMGDQGHVGGRLGGCHGGNSSVSSWWKEQGLCLLVQIP